MPQHLHLDFESFSKVDLKAVGTYRYAFDPSTEILCAGLALDREEPVVWWPGMPDRQLALLDPYFDALENPKVLIYAHNAMMEIAMCLALLESTWGIKPPALERFRCTMSLARRASLPGGLEKLSEVLGLTEPKDKRGKALIKKFSVMQPPKKPTKKNPSGLPERRIYPWDDPASFDKFKAYCAQDVKAGQEVARWLAYFDEPINNANYTLDAIINARGVTVNLSALRHAKKLIDQETYVVSRKFRELTGFDVTQNKVFLDWLHSQGCHLDNLQAETIEEFLEKYKQAEQDDWMSFQSEGENPCVAALQMKQSIAYASIKKVSTMLACAGPRDNRIRGMLNHHGATTGRWTASLVQFQNMKRPTIDNSEEAYRDICNCISLEMLRFCYGPPLEVISSCVRHFVHDSCPRCNGTGNGQVEFEGIPSCSMCGGTAESEFLDADYAAIEARIICWLAGQEDALEEYRQGIDRYKKMASLIYGIPEEEVNKFPQRYIGKQTILGCGFGMGPPKFRLDCKQKGGYDLPEGFEETAVYGFRNKHKAISRYFWDGVEDAAKQAILQKGETIIAKPKRKKGDTLDTVLPTFQKIAFHCMEIEGLPFLLIKLPSGRKLAYPRPQIVQSTRFEGRTSIVFFGKIGQTSNWGNIDTYGGKLAENITQAVAADIMTSGVHNAEAKGYETATLIHDEALSYYKENQTPEEFVKLLTQLQPWAKGLPIEAEGGTVPFYKKD